MRTPPADLRLYYVQHPTPNLPGVKNPQCYLPSLEVLFPSISEQSSGTPCLASTELITEIDSDNKKATIKHMIEKTERKDVPVWVRKMHLVNPLDQAEGLYILPEDGSLPAFRNAWQDTLRKINDPYNEAYTDAVFACMASRLVETGRSPHWCRFYGTFNGRVPVYRYNITPDMRDVEDQDWFRKGITDGKFRVFISDAYNPENVLPLTFPIDDVRQKLIQECGDTILSDHESGNEDENESDSGSEISIDEDTTDSSSMSTENSCDTTSSDSESICELEDIDDIPVEDEGASPTPLALPRLRLTRVSGSGHSSSEESDEDDDFDYHIEVENFPVQMTFMEKCDGTMDDLMEDEIAEEATDDMRETKEQRWTAWVFQVIAALTTAQQFYDFTHNDLHTNNIMWCGTGETHMYYHVQGAPGGDRYYRIPTYGRIFKIIDFGRAIFRPPMTVNVEKKKGSPMWFPDAYAPDADAAGQYNCGPYFEQGKPKITPNKSFDLSRLAVAILDTLWPDMPTEVEPRRVLTQEPGHTQHVTESPLWNLLWLWLTDKHGKNVLYNPDGSVRYPKFELYCAIARDVNNAVPAQQLTLPLFDGLFRCRKKDIPADATVWKLQASPR